MYCAQRHPNKRGVGVKVSLLRMSCFCEFLFMLLIYGFVKHTELEQVNNVLFCYTKFKIGIFYIVIYVSEMNYTTTKMCSVSSPKTVVCSPALTCWLVG